MDIAGKRGSSGIGLEIARILVARGTRVVVTGIGKQHNDS
jgi:NAD(P)-dependent dehydrogenase (short-subunit alcohol dehydrogenase family)